MQIFEQIYFGNTVQAWLIAAGIALGSIMLLEIIKRVVVGRLRAFAQTTITDIDDLFVDLLHRIKFITLLAISVYFASFYLVLPASTSSILRTVVVLLLLLQGAFWGNGIITYLVNRTVKQRLQEDASNATTLSALGFLGKLLLWVVVLLVGLDNMGVNITALVAGLGVGGIAVALALQNILSDLFASLSIVIDKPFVIGDFIIIDSYLGNVEHIGLKTTRIRSLSGEQLIFSNSDLLNSRVRNFKRMTERRILFSVGVTYQTPYEKVAAIPKMIRTAVEAQPNVRFDRSHFKEYGDSALVFETVYYVLSPEFGVYMDTQQEINLALYSKFQAEKIDFAYPTRTLFIQQETPAEFPSQGAKPKNS